ncbi:MAG: mechanosensitive ion channel family protein [Ignavibacteria bacterium]|nr:mechanosensitive ion channel family protein [Ignavibacteria bacterium]
MWNEILDNVILGNRVLDYLIAAGYFIAALLVIWVIKRIVIARLKKLATRTATTFDDFLIAAIDRSIVPLFYFGAFYLSVRTLTIAPGAEKWIEVIGVLLLTFLGIRFIVAMAEFIIRTYFLARQVDESKERTIKAILPAIKVVIWGLGLVFMLDNLGFKISAVLAGLGIGGIAVAIAAQSVLGEFFSYFSIIFDRPFEVGDFIIVGDQLGNVEKIGIKTSRIRSLWGEQLVFSNTDLTNSRIRNFKRMERRRITFSVGVTYQTSRQNVESIPGIISGIIKNNDKALFDRAHFQKYGDFALIFEAVYYVLTGDYNTYMDVQQDINLKIMEEFEKRNIEFAYPTQTLFLNKAEVP